jgi:hypothetical protein
VAARRRWRTHNKFNETGPINDMQFMPGHDNFIFCTSFDMQIRNTESGELVQSYPFGSFDIEFTPDSTRLIMLTSDGGTGKIQIRNLSDMSLIKEYKIPEGTDTAGYNIYESGIGFSEMVLDPIRPYVYAIRTRAGTLSGGKYFLIRRIVIINYETMEEVGILSVGEEDKTYFEKLAISKDGKYMAVNNQGQARLRVWSLDTRQKITDYRLYSDGNIDDTWCEPSYTKFSEINSDIIYFSGKFPKKGSGIFIFGISDNKILDSTFAVAPNFVYQGYFTLIDNEERAIKIDLKILILNFKNKAIEQKINQDTIKNGPAYWADKLLYSIHKDYLIGFSAQYFTFGKYTITTSTEDPFLYDSIIYPNPNTGFVTLQPNCQNPVQSYEILDINGLIIIPNTVINIQAGFTTIDISSLLTGTYFLRYYCGSNLTTYRVIKED